MAELPNHLASWPIRGVLPVLVTPFDDDGRVATDDLVRQVAHQLEHDVDGLVVFGLASEVYKLTEAERSHILEVVVAEATGRVPVVAGCEHTGVEAAADRAATAVRAGADALMAFPPSFVPLDDAGIVAYYAALAEAGGVPVIVQDAPGWTGVRLSVELLASLQAQVSTPLAVKVEAPPTARKIAALDGLGVPTIGGLGMLHLAEELELGVGGTMPGPGAPALPVEVWRHHRAAPERARAALESTLPLLVFQMASLDRFVAVQKSLLAKAGVLTSTRLRRPGVDLDRWERDWLDALIARPELAPLWHPHAHTP